MRFGDESTASRASVATVGSRAIKSRRLAAGEGPCPRVRDGRIDVVVYETTSGKQTAVCVGHRAKDLGHDLLPDGAASRIGGRRRTGLRLGQ